MQKYYVHERGKTNGLIIKEQKCIDALWEYASQKELNNIQGLKAVDMWQVPMLVNKHTELLSFIEHCLNELEAAEVSVETTVRNIKWAIRES